MPSTISVTDPTLVERARRGDGHAFAVLYRRHVRYVTGVLRRLIRPDESVDLDDMLQQTFADAYVGIGGLRNPSGFRPWLARIAARCAYDRLAARARLRWLSDALHWILPRMSDPRDCDWFESLAEAVEWMGPELSGPWWMHAVAGETLDVVAKSNGVSVSTIKRRIGDAQSMIEKKMGGQ